MSHRGLSHRLATLRAAVVPAVLSVLVVGTAAQSPAATSPPASRYASIVIDAETGTVLYERNADLPRYPASLTKVMTLYLAFEAIGAKKLSLTENLVMSGHAVSRDPSRLDLAAGSKLKVEDAIRAMTTKSANDAAAAIAERLAGGSESRFAQMMTARAKKLGLAHTTFRNASGLPEDGQVSTARDLALLCQALVRDFPEQYRYFSMRTFDYRGTRYPNQNRFLRTYYGADGIKTGFVNASGHNLAASAVRGGKRLIAVVLGGDTQSWTREHTTRLLDVSYAKIDPSLVMVASAAPAEGASAAAAGVAVAPAPPSSQPSPAAAAAPTVTTVTYATPAGAVTRPASPGLPLPNGTANLAAYASAGSAPAVPAGSVPDSPSLPSAPAASATAVAPTPAPVPPSPGVATETSPAKPSPIAPLDPAPVADARALPVSDPDTAAAIRATEQAAARPSTVSTNAVPPAPAPASAKPAAPAAAPAPKVVERVSAAPRTADSPQAPASGPTGERVVTNGGGGEWAVQVGLYRDATVARRRGEEARQRMPLALRNADLVVDRALDGKHVTSRIGRLSEQEARAACSELQRGSFPCVVVPPGRPMVVATN